MLRSSPLGLELPTGAIDKKQWLKRPGLKDVCLSHPRINEVIAPQKIRIIA